MDSRLYRHFFGNIPMNSVFHHYFPSHNLLSIEALKENLKESNSGSDDPKAVRFGNAPYCEGFAYESYMTKVLHPGSGLTDRACDIVKKKLYWNEKLAYKKPKKMDKALDCLKKLKEKGKEVNDSAVAKYLNWFNEDPLPGFKGDYNWLYTGGNITRINVNNNHWLITPDEIDGSTALNIIKSDSSCQWKDMQEAPHFLSKNDPVLQISSACKNNEIVMAVRQKNEISLYKFNDEFRLTEVDCCEIEGSKILTSSDLNSKCDRLAVTNNFEICIFDVHLRTNISKKLNVSGEGQWNQLFFYNDNVLCFADESCVRLFDLRQLSSTSNFLYKPTAVINNCELICNTIKSERRDDIYYVATSHNLIEADIRNGKNIQRWTHLMKSAPQFGRANYRDGEEIVVLQSARPYEIVGIVNESKSRKNDHFTSRSNPYALKSIKQNVKRAQQNGVCLQPFINERFNFTITGLDIWGSDVGADIFTVNGGGDVVLNRLKRKNSINSDGNDGLDQWNDALKNLEEFEDHFVDLQSSKHLIATMQGIDLSSVAKDIRNEGPVKKRRKKKEVTWPYSELYSSENLCYYKDIMSERILSVWGIAMKDMWDEIDVIECKLQEEMSAKSKVEEWMKGFQQNTDSPSS